MLRNPTMIKHIMLTAALTAVLMLCVFPPRRYVYTDSPLTGMREPYVHGEVPGRKPIFSEDIYTAWHGEAGVPVAIDLGRLIAELGIVGAVTGFGLLSLAMLEAMKKR